MALSGQAHTLLTKLSDTFKAEFKPGKVLGEGTMGVVISATQMRLGRQVAIKFLLCFSDPSALNRFSREAQLSSSLDHPNIVRLFTSGVDGELPYLVYEFVFGQTLKDFVADANRLAPAQALPLARQLLEGLAHAHALSIVHRDLKPANILVDAEGALKIADYGIGSSLVVEWALTRTGTLMGTPAYMSPEQWSATTTIATDVYSAGVVVQEMLTGANPFAKSTLIATRNAHVHEPRPPLGDVFDPRYDELLDAMCAKEAAARPSAAECIMRLDEIRTRRLPRGGARTDGHKPIPDAPAGAAEAQARASGSGPRSGMRAGHHSGGASGPGSGGAGAVDSTGGSSGAPGPVSTLSSSGSRRNGLSLAIALVIFAAGLLPFLHPAATLAGPATAVAGCRSAALHLECDRSAEPGAVVEPTPAGLHVTPRDRDGGKRRWTLQITGLEPGVPYRVQPLLAGKPAGPVVPLTTLGGPEQLAAVISVAFTDAKTLRVRFRSPLLLPAALAISQSLPSDWATGVPGEPRVVMVTGLDPALTYEPFIVFDGLSESVPLGRVPGSGKVVELSRRALASKVGGPQFADRIALLKRIAVRAQKRVVTPERVREAVERHVKEATGHAVELVLTAAVARAADAGLPLADRWRASEVLDGLMVLESVGHPWCNAWVLDMASRRPGFPRWEWAGRVPRPPEAPRFDLWVPAGPVREHVARSSLPIWTHRERPLNNILLLKDNVANSHAIEQKLARAPGWAWITPPAPPDRLSDVELVLKVFNIVEDHLLWLRFAGAYTLAVPGPRGSKPARVVSEEERLAAGRGLRVTLPAEVWRDTQGVELRFDGFEATEKEPIPDESWIADAWVMSTGP